MLLVFFGWACKEKPDKVKPKVEEAKKPSKAIIKVSPTIKELAKFADLPLTDATDINELILFREIDINGVVTEIDDDRAVALYKKMTKRGAAISFPIFEIKNNDTAIIPLQGVGFGGAIWAKVLIDRNTLEIKKIAFEHKAESDDYGGAMTQTSFENQFIGKKINLEEKTFWLQKAIEKSNDDGHLIDGISGATVTNEGIVEMLNVGLQRYRNYLQE